MEQLHFQSNLQVDFLEVGSLAIPPITVTFSIGPKEPLQFNLYCPTGEESREPSGCYSWPQKRNSLELDLLDMGNYGGPSAWLHSLCAAVMGYWGAWWGQIVSLLAMMHRCANYDFSLLGRSKQDDFVIVVMFYMAGLLLHKAVHCSKLVPRQECIFCISGPRLEN